MKSKEELHAIKEEIAALNAKLAELSEDELKEVTGGMAALIAHGAVVIANGGGIRQTVSGGQSERSNS